MNYGNIVNGSMIWVAGENQINVTLPLLFCVRLYASERCFVCVNNRSLFVVLCMYSPGPVRKHSRTNLSLI